MDNAQQLARNQLARLLNQAEQVLSGEFSANKTLSDALANYDSRLTEMADLAFREAWLEGGGDPADVDAADLEIVADWVEGQTAHVNDFSNWLEETRRTGAEIDDRVRDWVSSLRNLGEQVKARAMGDPPLKLDGDDGAESCDECQEYKGQVHRLSWWERRGLTARNGNENYGCKRFDNCQHSFYHAKTGELVIR